MNEGFPYEEVGGHRFAKWREASSRVRARSPITAGFILGYWVGFQAFCLLESLIITEGLFSGWNPGVVLLAALLLMCVGCACLFGWVFWRSHKVNRDWIESFHAVNPGVQGVRCTLSSSAFGIPIWTERGVAQFEGGEVRFWGSDSLVVLHTGDLAARQRLPGLNFVVPGVQGDRKVCLNQVPFTFLAREERKLNRKAFREASAAFKIGASEGVSIYPPVRARPIYWKPAELRKPLFAMFLAGPILGLTMDLLLHAFAKTGRFASNLEWAQAIGIMFGLVVAGVVAESLVRVRILVNGKRVDALLEHRNMG